jgi:hypothetical protein
VSAPDYAEALIGWRVWCVVRTDGRLRLASVIHDEVWPSDTELVARCNAVDATPHAAPSPECMCGIHAAREPSTVWTYLRGRDDPGTVTRVLGRVALWGKIVEHEHGWRAQYAYPLDVYTGDRELRIRLSSLLDAGRAHLGHARQRRRARRGPC